MVGLCVCVLLGGLIGNGGLGCGFALCVCFLLGGFARGGDGGSFFFSFFFFFSCYSLWWWVDVEVFYFFFCGMGGSRVVQTTRISDPPGQTDQTRTIHRSIRLLRRSVAGPYFSKPIPTDRVRVFSSNTQATRPDRHINGFKGLKLVTLISYSHSLLSVSRSLLPIADPARR